jgi:hypothetical protein
MQAIPHFLFSPHDLKTFLGLYLGVNPFRAPPGAMEVCENIILRSQGVLEPRLGYSNGAVSPIPIDAFAYKADQQLMAAFSYAASLPSLLPQSLAHATPFAVYDWEKDVWNQAFMLPGNLPFDRPDANARVRFASANNALYLQSRYGLLKIENAAAAVVTTNLIQESVRFTSAPWAASRTTVSDFQLAAPDNNVAAAKLQATAVAGTHLISHPVSGLVSASSYAFSAFAKAGTASWLAFSDSAGNGVVFDLTNGLVAQEIAGARGAIHPMAGAAGWYRCTMTWTNATSTGPAISYGDTQAHAVPGASWTPAGTETVFVYGAQLELLGANSPAPILHTKAGTATRSNGALKPAMLLKPWSQPVGSAWAGSKPALSSLGTWLAPGFQVAYRYTVARKGANRELIESEPSERIIVVNTTSQARGVVFTFDAPPMYPRDAFIRLWKATQAPTTADPQDEMFLVAELQFPSLAPLGSDGYLFTAAPQTVSYTDLTPDTALYVPLYTNPSTGEGRGLLDSNNTSPRARDICYFKNRMYSCNVRDVHRIILKVIGTGSGGIANNSSIAIDGVTFSFAADDTQAMGPQVFTAGTVAQNLENTARALIAHINYYFSGRSGVFKGDLTSMVYASYLSVSSGGAGQILLQRAVPGAEPIRVTTSSRNGWDRDYTTEFTSDDSFQAAGVTWSKVGQPECVPIANSAIAGDASMEAMRLIALREALFLFKKDGLFKITDDGTGPTIQLLDPTVRLIAPETAVALDNVIVALTQSGAVLVSEGSGAINISDDQIGRPLRKLMLYVGPDTLARVAYGVAYQGQRQYILALPESPTATAATLYYVYNLQTQAWTTATLPLPTVAGLAHFDQNVMYYAPKYDRGDNFTGFFIERSAGGSADYQDPSGILRSPTSAAVATMVFTGDLTKTVYDAPNIITDSQDRFASSTWTKSFLTATDLDSAHGAAPDGSPYVSLLVDTAANNAHRIVQAVAMEAGQTYTVSCHLKADTLGFCSIDTQTGAYAVFNLSNGTVSATALSSAAVVSLGNGWYRCSVTFVYTAVPGTACSVTLQIGTSAAQATPGNTYAGAVQGLLAWGVQAEKAAAVSPYVPTPLRPPLAVGDVVQQFQTTKALTQVIRSVTYNSATDQTTVTFDSAPTTAWTTTDDLRVMKAIQSRWRMLPQTVDHPLTAKNWVEAFLSFRYFDLDTMQVEWTSETFQYATDNPATELIASPTPDAAPILILPFSNQTGPFGRYCWGRQTRDVVFKASLHPEVSTSGQLMLGCVLGQAGRRFEMNGFDVVMSGKTEHTVR